VPPAQRYGQVLVLRSQHGNGRALNLTGIWLSEHEHEHESTGRGVLKSTIPAGQED